MDRGGTHPALPIRRGNVNELYHSAGDYVKGQRRIARTFAAERLHSPCKRIYGTEHLEQLYGVPEWKPRQNPLDELIHCILSQHTSDANSFRAYRLMRERYPTWEAVANAPVEELAETIRPGGLANQKAPRIQAVLRVIKDVCGDYMLDWLRDLPTPDARQFLLGLPGIGPKCAAIVLPQIAREFGWDDCQIGQHDNLLLGAFYLTFGIAQVILSVLCHKFVYRRSVSVRLRMCEQFAVAP